MRKLETCYFFEVSFRSDQVWAQTVLTPKENWSSKGQNELLRELKWGPLKQTKTKDGHHFRRLTFNFIQLCFLPKMIPSL